MLDDIRQWLEELGLGEYVDAFVENRIDADVLSKLTSNDLKDIGVIAVGDRRKMLDAMAALSESGVAPNDTNAASPSEQRSMAAERRQLTVMFCDLVGSTTLSRQLDPEDLRDVMRRYQDAVAGAVTRYGGHVAKYLGDGVLAYFGWPQAYEDQAERAVRAGLDAVEIVNNVQVGDGRSLEARVGIATGQVVVGDLVGESGRDAEAVSGQTPNLAARLQGVAEPGQVVIGDATRRLIGQTFALADLGAQELKGFDAPMHAWAIAGEESVESRFDAAHGSSVMRLVGREGELQLLLQRWQLARQGEGQAVLLSGEAGIGKSHLSQALCDALKDQPYTLVRCQCSPYHSNSAFYPVIQQLRRAAGFTAADDDDARLDKLERLPGVTAPTLLANLLSLPHRDRYGEIDLTPAQIKQETIAAIVAQLLYQAARRPLLLLLEDAHWIDPTSTELLELVIARGQQAPILIVVTHRPEWQSQLGGHNHVTSLRLNRLGERQVAEIVRAVAGDYVSDEVVARIVARTDGVPLFVEELTRLLVEGGLDIAVTDIPETLQASLLARIDRLGAEAKEIAQIGAVIGREFPHDLLAAVAARPAAELEPPLERLTRSELVFRAGTPAHITYTFKHALVQDEAYGSLLRSNRRNFHRRIAEVLVAHFAATVESEPELVAYHFTAAGLVEPAIEYWRRAGARAALDSANVEAVHHFGQALELLGDLPDTPERARRELTLRIDMGGPLLMTKGHAAPEVEQAYARARELCQKVGDSELLVPALFGLWRYYVGASNLSEMLGLGEQLLVIGQETGDPAHLVVAHYALGLAKLCHGDPVLALYHLEAGSNLYRPEQRSEAVFRSGQDPGVACLVYAALAQCVLGHPVKAVDTSARALAFAAELSHPFSLAFALTFDAYIHQVLNDPVATLRQARAAITLSTEQGFSLWATNSRFSVGWALARDGRAEEGAQQSCEAHDMFRASPTQVFAPYMLGLYAETCGIAGRIDVAHAAMEEALAKIEDLDEHLWEVETLRLRGELLLAGPAPQSADAEACFRRAIAVADAQEAHGLGLKAALSFARLAAAQGRSEEVRRILEPVYGRFTEGFDTPDLIDAKALLDELN
jgi:class 3 adenylate cyclase/predicted ATPase